MRAIAHLGSNEATREGCTGHDSGRRKRSGKNSGSPFAQRVTHIDDASDEPDVAARISINGRFNHLLTNSDRPKVHQHLKCSNDGGSLAVQFLTMALDSYSPVSVVALQCLPERLPFSSFYFSQDAVLGFQGLVMHWPAHLLRFYLFFFFFSFDLPELAKGKLIIFS